MERRRADTTVVFAGEAVPHAAFRTPENDDFSDAAELEDAVEGNLLLASTEPGEPSLEPGSERPVASVWYRYTGDADGPIHFTVTPDAAFGRSERRSYGIGGRSLSDFEMRLDVYRGESVAALRPVAGAPWGASFLAERGTEYVLRVAGEARAAPFLLSWREGGAPDNDAFDAAVVLDGGQGQVTGTNAGVTLQPGEFFGALAATVWYSWTAPADGWHEFRSTAGHLKVLAFQDGGSVGDLRLVSGYPEAAIRFPARAGDACRIAVAAPEAEVAGADFEMSWSRAGPGETGNDLVEDARRLPEDRAGERAVHLAAEQRSHETGGLQGREAREPRVRRLQRGPDRRVLLQRRSGPAVPVGCRGCSGHCHVHGSGRRRQRRVGLTPSNDTWSRAAFLRGAAGTLQSSNRFATAGRDERIWDVGHSSLWWSFEAPAAGWNRFWIEDAGSPLTLSAYRAGVPRRAN